MHIQNIAKWAVLVPLFTIPFLALYVSSDLYFPFITGKNFAFRVLVEIALVGYLVLALADRRYRPQFSWVFASFVLLVLWMIVADAFAVNPHKAFWSNFERMDGFVTLAHVFALFLVAGPVLSIDKLWRKWWMTLVGVSAILSMHGVFQFFGAAAIHQSTTRLDASLGNSEYFAGFLLLAIGITVWQAFETKTQGLRYSLFALVALQVLILFGTGTRGTFVALLGASVFGGLLWLFEMGKRGRKSALVFLAAVLVFLGGFYAVRNTTFIQESPNLSRFADISLSALDVRFKVWDMALSGIAERPVTGWGHEGYNYVFNTYYDPSMYGQEPWFDRAHNIYLDWLIAGGIPALLFFLMLGGSALFAVYRASNLKSWERVVIISVLVAYGIQGLAVFDNLFTYVPLALLLAYAHTLRTRSIVALEQAPEIKGPSLEVITAPVAVILAVFLIYMVNVPTYTAGKDLIRGLTPNSSVETRLGYFKTALERDPFATQEIREQLTTFAQQVSQSTVPDPVKAEVLAYASAEIEKEIARAPGDARLYAIYASFLRISGQFDKAREIAAQGRALSPKKQSIIIEQGIIEWQADKPAAAQGFFTVAYELATTSDDLLVYVASGHIITGDVAGGKVLLQERFGTTTVNDMALVLAYQRLNAWNEIIPILSLRYRELNDPTAGYQLAIAYASAGRLAEARQQARTVMQAHPNTTAQGTQLLMQLGVR